MIEPPGIALAFAAGFVSFVSPCCLPLVPGYLATVTGVPGEERTRRLDRRVLGRSLLFVLSFSSIFILLGLSATALGAFLLSNKPALERVGGLAIIAMGLLMISSVFVVRLNRDWRPRWLSERAPGGGPVTVGAAFALGWTPCVGPTLGAILGLAAAGRSTAEAALLLGVYSARARRAVPPLGDRLRRGTRQPRIRQAPLRSDPGRRRRTAVATGVLVISGELFRLNIEAQHFLSRFGLNFFQSV